MNSWKVHTKHLTSFVVLLVLERKQEKSFNMKKNFYEVFLIIANHVLIKQDPSNQVMKENINVNHTWVTDDACLPRLKKYHFKAYHAVNFLSSS